MIKNGRRGTLSGRLARQGRAGPHRLPAPGARTRSTRSRRRWPNWCATRLGRRQRVLPADQLADVEHPRRHRRRQRHPGRSGDRLQFPLLDRIDARVAAAARARGARPARPRLHARLDPRRPALPDAARQAGRGAGARHPTPRPASHRAVDHRRHPDGRFIAKICPQVVEFGPVNASIHKIDEHVEVAEHRAAEEHLPRAGRLRERCSAHDADRTDRAAQAPASKRAFRLATAPTTPSTKRCGWCCGAWACRWTSWTRWPTRELAPATCGALDALIDATHRTRASPPPT